MSGIADLLGAIRRGDARSVGDLLAAGPDLANARDEHANSPLLIATYIGKHDIVRLLLERGARASFFEACALGLVGDVRRHLREYPESVGQWSHDGWPPLHLAAFFGHRETVEALLDAGADVRAVARNSEANLAINAAAAGPGADRRPEIVRLLIARGCPVDGRGSPAGHTPLHEAAFNGDLALVRLLLASGADRSVRTGDGKTALDIAVKHGRHEAARLLEGGQAPKEASVFKRIDHVEIVTDQLDRAVQFYTDVLGFKVRAREHIDRAAMGVTLDLVYLDLGGTGIELIKYGSPVEAAPSQEHLGYRMMALEVADMQSTVDYLKTKGVAITWGPRVREGEYARAEIRDPDGHGIELRHWFRR